MATTGKDSADLWQIMRDSVSPGMFNQVMDAAWETIELFGTPDQQVQVKAAIVTLQDHFGD